MGEVVKLRTYQLVENPFETGDVYDPLPNELYDPIRVLRKPCCLCGKPTHRDDTQTYVEGTTTQITTVTAQQISEHNAHVDQEHYHYGSFRAAVIDLCAGCFESKLMPWIASQGGSARVIEVDYGDDTGVSRPKAFRNVRANHEQHDVEGNPRSV